MDVDRDPSRKIATQHRLIETLFTSLANAVADRDGERALARCGGLRRALDAHFLLEEEHYFPRMRAARPDRAGDLERLVDEHRVMRERAGRLASHLEATAWETADRARRDLQSLFESHEAFEHKIIAGG